MYSSLNREAELQFDKYQLDDACTSHAQSYNNFLHKQMREIMAKINEAINSGEYSILADEPIHLEVAQYLESCGYIITQADGLYKISW